MTMSSMRRIARIFPGDFDSRAIRAASVRSKASVLVLLGALLCCRIAVGEDRLGEDFFEKKIRPVLVNHCYECHSAGSDQIGGSLWLDSAAGMRTGGDSGPAIVPGDAEASTLISALRYESTEMPPDQPLPKSVVDDFVRWINSGAVDPRRDPQLTERRSQSADQIDLEQGRQFWSFQPIVDVRDELPRGERAELFAGGTRGIIDALLDRALQAARIEANGAAKPSVQLRRLSFDLTGLPPAAAFADSSLPQRWLSQPTAAVWEQLVDELLASRAFAQHWARHWMDVARYADSNGSDFNATFHDAWRYRDYLVDSFDQDRPLDQMIRQQIAGDLMPAESDDQRHANVVATTFLMLGPKMLSERDKPKLTLDVVDEQIDTIGRAFLGMTLGCGRCHDHKFDPIATEDYYALAGIFKSTQTLNGESQKYVSTWNRVELPTTKSHRESLAAFKAEREDLEKRIKNASEELAKLSLAQPKGIVVDDGDAKKVGNWVDSTYSKHFIGSGYVHDNNAGKGDASIRFEAQVPTDGEYVVRIAYSPGSNRAKRVPIEIVTEEGPVQVTFDQQAKHDQQPWKKIGTYRFASSKPVAITLTNEGTEGYVIADAIQLISVDKQDQSDEAAAQQRVLTDARGKVESLKKQLEELEENEPPPIPVAMAPRDRSTEKIGDSPVHIRGEVRNTGDVIPRGFLRVCSAGDATIDSPAGSGRLELAYWLTDPDNPLVARVMVNRIWMHLFGEGIVRTVDNFGSRGERPTHPELLDTLAIDLMRDGWSLKTSVRRMVLSKAYRRSSAMVSQAEDVDPENRLLWRAHRKRLTAESIRDSMLVAAGKLTDEEPTEPVADKGVLVTRNVADSKEVASGVDEPLRTLYLPVIRGNLDPLLTSLDFADPDLLVGKRPTTNVPAQAFVLLNSEVVNEWAELTAQRVFAEAESVADRIDAAYRICLSRPASEQDLQLAQHYLGIDESTGDEVLRSRLRDLVASLFASTEFRMLD
jgi:hypothetical protein